VLVEAVLRIRAEAGELRVHDEVDDAGNGVGTVDRGSAAGQHVDPADQCRRNEVDVGDGNGLGRIAGLEAAAVDQHQGARGAEVAKIDGGGAGGAVGEIAALTGEGLRQRVDQILGAGRALKADLGAVDHSDRAGAGKVRARNARAGNDDRFVLSRRRGGRIGLRLIGLGEGGCGNADRPADYRGRQQIAQKLIPVRHVGPLRSASAVSRAPALTLVERVAFTG